MPIPLGFVEIVMMQAKDTDLLCEPRQPSAFTLTEFSTLYQQYADAVYANIFKLVKRPDDAADILQDVFATLWESRYKLNSHSINGWLFVVSHNKAMDHLKHQLTQVIDAAHMVETLPDTTPESTEKEARHEAQWHMIMEAVNALPLRKKEVFQLCRLEGRSKEEVAAIMGISAKSVADYLKQAHKAIKDYITARYPYAMASGALLVVMLSL